MTPGTSAAESALEAQVRLADLIHRATTAKAATDDLAVSLGRLVAAGWSVAVTLPRATVAWCRLLLVARF